MQKGFTIIEMLVVAGITIFITTFLLLNFSRDKIDFDESINSFKSDLRIAQTKTISSTKYDDKIRCGYGIRYINETTYGIYVGENATSHNCPSQNRDFNPVDGDLDADVNIQVVNFSDARVEFKTIFRAVYFEPPDPKTFIIDLDGTVHNESGYGLNITMGRIGTTCPEDCKTVTISTSGKIE